MKRNWFRFSSIRARVIVLPVLGILGMIVIAGANKVLDLSMKSNIELGRESQKIENDLLKLMMIEERFINNHDQALLAEHKNRRDALAGEIAAQKTATDDPRIQALVEEMAAVEQQHARIFNEVSKNAEEMDQAKAEIAKDNEKLSALIQTVVASINQEEANLMMEGESLDMAQSGLRAEIKDLLRYESERMLNIQDLFLFGDPEKYEAAQQALQEKLALKEKNSRTALQLVNKDEYNQAWKQSEAVLARIEELEQTVFGQWQENLERREELRKTGKKVEDAAAKILEFTKSGIEKSAKLSDLVSWVVSLGGVLVLLIAGFLISRKINQSLQTAIDGLMSGAEQVAAGSIQVASSSQSLAEGASEQAASIEETSSSLEEMSSMTKQNAANANQANALMQEANGIVATADQAMDELIRSMAEISSASEETQKIIKTIDEIAFQTNLLALNAAVEAARAGEAGAGFAVVADEVRNLAMRAAEAAGNTAQLIEGTVHKVQKGSDLMNRTNEALGAVSGSAAKVGDIVAEIAGASNEQAQGIEQINKAVAEMDRVVQQNAANSEESASASEEMSAQAEQMKEIVNDLAALVGGAANRRRQESYSGVAWEPDETSRSLVSYTPSRVPGGKNHRQRVNPGAGDPELSFDGKEWQSF